MCVFLYNVLSGSANIALGNAGDTNVTSAASISPYTNSTALIEDYVLDSELYRLVQDWPHGNFSSADFGLSILLINFAYFYGRNQYVYFAYTFQCVREMYILEEYLLRYKHKSIILPANMATDDRYGLKQLKMLSANAGHFKSLITLSEFTILSQMMQNNNTTPEMFVKCLHKYHINIIETFYMFTSITKDCKAIRESHDYLLGDNFNYNFNKIIPTGSIDDALLWFAVPPNTVWFAYSQRRIKFSAFVNKHTEMSVKHSLHFAPIDFVFFGYVGNGIGNVVAFEQCEYYGKWEQIVKMCKNYDISCPLQSTENMENKNVYFVKLNNCNIFKYVIKK